MKASLVSVVVIATFAVAVSVLGVRRPSPERVAAPAVIAEGTKMLGRLPVAFVPNLGQWEHAARYVARVGAMTVFLEQQGWSFTLVERTARKGSERRDRVSVNSVDEKPARGVAVRMAFAGARQSEMTAEERLPGVHNYFLGTDPSKWRSDVPLYGAVRYRELYSGVDVRAREHGGYFEYDLLLLPGADLQPVEIVVEGIDRMHLDEDGALVMHTRLGPVRMPVPLSWEEGASGEKKLVACQYELRSADRLGFKVIGRRPGWALVVDPGLVWSTFLGGASYEYATAVALDTQGASTVAGGTSSSNFPTTPGAFDTSYNNGDAFVTRLSPTGSTLVYSTVLGGADSEGAEALALDGNGAATVAGWTRSTNFPTTPGAFDTTYNGGATGSGIPSGDVFVARLSPTGSSLVYSTYLGGVSDDVVSATSLDAQGAGTFAGWTQSPDFPTSPGAFDTTYNGGAGPGGGDAFVTRLSPTGTSVVYSTFLGGAGLEKGPALALDAQGAATLAGHTRSANFPTTPGAFDTSYDTGDAFVTRLDMLPTGVAAFGDSSPGCNGPLPISVNSMPRVGNAAFALTCGNAAPNSIGLIAFAGGGFLTPVPVLGVNVWIDPTVLFGTPTVFSNSIGASEVPLPIPPDPALAGWRCFAQFLWLGPRAPTPCPPVGFSATNALDFTIQP